MMSRLFRKLRNTILHFGKLPHEILRLSAQAFDFSTAIFRGRFGLFRHLDSWDSNRISELAARMRDFPDVAGIRRGVYASENQAPSLRVHLLHASVQADGWIHLVFTSVHFLVRGRLGDRANRLTLLGSPASGGLIVVHKGRASRTVPSFSMVTSLPRGSKSSGKGAS